MKNEKHDGAEEVLKTPETKIVMTIDDLLLEVIAKNRLSSLSPNADQDLSTLYAIAKSILPGKIEDRSRLIAMDELMLNLIYAKESLSLNGRKRNLEDKYALLINKFSSFPALIAKTRGTNLEDLSLGVNRLVVLITHSCQLRCSYCSVRKFSAEMSEDTLKRAIDLLFTSKKDEVELQFFGGEPLLRFPLVMLGAEYAQTLAKKTGKSLKLLLTTNGLALTDKMIEFLLHHKFTVEFSLDGDAKSQLGNRKLVGGGDYYNIVFENLKRLKKAGVNHYVISVVTPANVSSMENNFAHLSEQGFTNLQINYALGQLWSEEKKRTFMSSLAKIADTARKRGDITLMNLLMNRREPAVLNSEITLDCNGDIYFETGICLEEDFNKLKQDFFIGSLDTVDDINKVLMMRSNTFGRLIMVYSKEKPEFKEIILNNISMGLDIRKLFASIESEVPNG